MTEIILTSLSPSAINQIKRCPRQWQLSMQLASRIEVESKYLVLGRKTHEIIASYYRIVGQTPTEQTIHTTADKVFERWYAPEIKTMLHQVNELKKNFIAYELQRHKTWQQYRPTLVEKKLNVKIWNDLPEFHPIIDFYSEPQKTIIDWKTGTVEMNEELMIQGKIYELSLRAMAKPVEHVIFVGLKHNVAYEMPKVQDGWAYGICKDVADLIKSGHFPKRPTPLCGWCSFILNCEFDYTCLWDGL